MVAILVLLTIIAFLTVDYFAQQRVARLAPVAGVATIGETPRPAADLLELPAGAFLAPGHVWMRLETDGTVRLGADRFAPGLLGGIDRCDVAMRGNDLRTGDPIAVLHHAGREVTLRSPVDGHVESVNTRLAADPAAAREGDGSDAWLCTVRPRDVASALRRAKVAEEARDWLRQEVAALRDFLAGTMPRERALAATLADGGLPVDGLASHLDAKVWTALVARFFTEG